MRGVFYSMIIFSGPVGVGKTTWATKVAQELGVRHWQEDLTDKELLVAYYQEPERWGFTSQLSFLMAKANIYQMANRGDIVERCMEEDLLFARINHQLGRITNSEYRLYSEVHAHLQELIASRFGGQRKPSLFVVLTADFDTIKRRMVERARQGEAEDEEIYWRTLYNAYAEWLDGIKVQGNVILWDTTKHDAFHEEDVRKLSGIIVRERNLQTEEKEKKTCEKTAREEQPVR